MVHGVVELSFLSALANIGCLTLLAHPVRRAPNCWSVTVTDAGCIWDWYLVHQPMHRSGPNVNLSYVTPVGIAPARAQHRYCTKSSHRQVSERTQSSVACKIGMTQLAGNGNPHTTGQPSPQFDSMPEPVADCRGDARGARGSAGAPANLPIDRSVPRTGHVQVLDRHLGETRQRSIQAMCAGSRVGLYRSSTCIVWYDTNIVRGNSGANKTQYLQFVSIQHQKRTKCCCFAW